jgi:uncharacterized membrane protein YqjE
VRLLWLLPKAAPVLLRHFVAYAELAGLDLARTQRDLLAQLIASALLLIGVFFALLMGCLLVVAYTWDTHYRIAAIAWMGGGFLLVAAAAALFRSNVSRAQTPFLASVRREWQEDRVILERILSSDEE